MTTYFSMLGSDVFFYIDESGTDAESEILILTCVITENPSYLRGCLNTLRHSCLKDPSLNRIPSVQKLSSNHSFHYCEDHPVDIRPKVLDLIRSLPFEAYISYQEKPIGFNPSQGYSWYDEIFYDILHDRLQAYANSSISICFEQHSNRLEKRRLELEDIIGKLVRKFRKNKRNNFPISPIVNSAGKDEICLTLPDYISGVFYHYKAFGLGKSEDIHSRNFDKFRPKIRVIHDITNSIFYTRHNPFP